MYFPDLTPYEYAVEKGDAPALNVGWLDATHEFTKGTPPPGFVDRLRVLSRTRVKQMRGFEVCPFCPELRSLLEPGDWSEQQKALYRSCFEDGRFSSAEIRVTGPDGRVYASPVMILHYLEAHGYLPPRNYIEAVMQTVSDAAEARPARSWWHEVPTPARAAFVCGVPIALGLGIGEAAAGDALGPEHPLALPRLALRLGCFLASGVCFAIAGVGQFRAWRGTKRMREGLCLTCGYDLRVHTGGDRCPECGLPSAPPPARPAP